jgi:hypothetical protein
MYENATAIVCCWYRSADRRSRFRPSACHAGKPHDSAATCSCGCPGRTDGPRNRNATGQEKAFQTPATAAPGGGPDKVWVNSGSKVYHCPGGKYYGKTKAGAYMSEADAKAAGNHAVSKKGCF